MPFDYFLFYKPYQVLSQFSPDGGKKCLADFFSGIKKDIYPVGRLDYDSEGLLLLTNDKVLNHQLIHPKFAHEREYWVQVEGIPSEESMLQLQSGTEINIDGKIYRTKKAKASLDVDQNIIPDRDPPIRYRKNIPDTWMSLTLTEGKNRQVRKMTASVGLPTLRLIRYRIGALTIKEMSPGEFRKLTHREATSLLQ